MVDYGNSLKQRLLHLSYDVFLQEYVDLRTTTVPSCAPRIPLYIRMNKPYFSKKPCIAVLAPSDRQEWRSKGAGVSIAATVDTFNASGISLPDAPEFCQPQ